MMKKNIFVLLIIFLIISPISISLNANAKLVNNSYNEEHEIVFYGRIGLLDIGGPEGSNTPLIYLILGIFNGNNYIKFNVLKEDYYLTIDNEQVSYDTPFNIYLENFIGTTTSILLIVLQSIFFDFASFKLSGSCESIDIEIR